MNKKILNLIFIILLFLAVNIIVSGHISVLATSFQSNNVEQTSSASANDPDTTLSTSNVGVENTINNGVSSSSTSSSASTSSTSTPTTSSQVATTSSPSSASTQMQSYNEVNSRGTASAISLDLSNMLNIILIAIGIVLILLGIAILIRTRT